MSIKKKDSIFQILKNTWLTHQEPNERNTVMHAAHVLRTLEEKVKFSKKSVLFLQEQTFFLWTHTIFQHAQKQKEQISRNRVTQGDPKMFSKEFFNIFFQEVHSIIRAGQIFREKEHLENILRYILKNRSDFQRQR